MVDVFQYSNFRRFLQDWFEEMKETTEYMSHRWFARKIGSGSPSVLNNIMRKNGLLRGRLLDQFVDVIGFDPAEAEYFRLLVQFYQTEYIEDKDRLHARLLALRARARPSMTEEHIKILSDPIYAAVLELTRCVGARSDPAWFATHLDPEKSVEEVTEALALLLRTGMLIETESGLLRENPSTETPAEVADLGGYSYHRQTDQLAERALVKHLNESAIFGATVAIPSDRIKDFRVLLFTKIAEISKEVDHWESPNQVMQVNLRAFPLTKNTSS